MPAGLPTSSTENVCGSAALEAPGSEKSSAAFAGLGGRLAIAAGVAESLYASAIVIDGLGGPGGLDSERGGLLSAAEVSDVAKSGLTAVHATVGDVGTRPSLAAFESVVRDVSRLEREIELHPDVFARVRAAADIESAKTSGRTGLLYGLQDGVSFEDDLDRLEMLHRLGVRVVQPTYNRRNLLGYGCMEPANAGLSRDGRVAIERMNTLGIMVDMSHCGRQTTADAFDVTKSRSVSRIPAATRLRNIPGIAPTKRSGAPPTAAA